MNANQHKATAWVGEADFELAVLRSKQPVLVTFWAPWSRPCHIIDSVLDKVATACAGSVKVVKVNADNHPALSLLYEIQSIPTLLYIVDGIVREKMVGTTSTKAILSKLQSFSIELPLPPAAARRKHSKSSTNKPSPTSHNQ